MMYKKEQGQNDQEESINRQQRKFADMNVVPSRRSVKWYQGTRGGMQIAGAGGEKEDEEEIKTKKRGGETPHPETKAGQKPPRLLAELSFFSRWLFRGTCFYVGSYGKLSSWDWVFLLLLCMCLCL